VETSPFVLGSNTIAHNALVDDFICQFSSRNSREWRLMSDPSEVTSKKRQAFVLRIAPSEVDRVDEALKSNELIIGWSLAKGLLNKKLNEWTEFRQIIHDAYYSEDKDHRRSGSAAGHMWRFRGMPTNALVVVPHASKFYVAEVTSNEAYYDETKVADDTSHRRPVKWLNECKPIPRSLARAALQSRMKIQGTCASAEDLLDEIIEVLELAQKGKVPTFEADLRSLLVKETIREIRRGRIDSYKFESLIKTVLESLGATNTRIVPRSQDKGADILANFSLANTFVFKLAVQAKHWQNEPPVSKRDIDQLVQGMEAEGTQLGWFITSGSFTEEAEKYSRTLLETRGYRIELIDGPHLATLIVEGGLAKLVTEVDQMERG